MGEKNQNAKFRDIAERAVNLNSIWKRYIWKLLRFETQLFFSRRELFKTRSLHPEAACVQKLPKLLEEEEDYSTDFWSFKYLWPKLLTMGLLQPILYYSYFRTGVERCREVEKKSENFRCKKRDLWGKNATFKTRNSIQYRPIMAAILFARISLHNEFCI